MKKKLQNIKKTTAKFGLISTLITMGIQGNSQTTTVVYSGAITTYTVPTGVNSISIEGRGGQGKSAQAGFVGGNGAKMKGDFTVIPGDVLLIAVGGQGLLAGAASGGGGGGTFIVKIDPLSLDIMASGPFTGTKVTPLIIAGGGGGCRDITSQNGNPGVTTTFATNASGSGTTGGGITKSTELGIGGIMSSSSWGSAGGGFRGNGANDGTYGTGGFSFLNGAVGGSGYCSSGGISGGFGSGGSGGGCDGGGGGGGYSGGDGGRVAGGGGSWNTGTNQSNVSGFQTGDGVAIITVLYGVTIAQTSTIACNGLLTAALSASVSGGVGPFTYSWSPSGGTAATATGLGAGTYTCTVISATSGTVSSSFTVTQPAVIVSTVASQTNVSCYGGANGVITLTTTGGTAPYSYSWTPTGGSTATASGLVAGTYSCTVKDANLCSAPQPSATISQPATFSVVSSNSVICAGESANLTATGATSYTWNTAATTSVIAVSPSVTTTYTVTGMTGVCSNSLTITQNVNTCVGVQNLTNNDLNITFYPNPNNGVFTIELNTTTQVIITNVLGDVLLNSTFNNGKQILDIQNKANGIYFMKLVQNGKQQTVKLIKE